MKRLISSVFAASLLVAAPAFAGGGHGNGHGHGHGKHHWKHDRHAQHHYGPPRHVVQHVHRYQPPRVVHHYHGPSYYAQPYYAPASGIHVVLPNVYIPFN